MRMCQAEQEKCAFFMMVLKSKSDNQKNSKHSLLKHNKYLDCGHAYFMD